MSTGPVFPVLKGKRAGERQGQRKGEDEPKRQGKRSHARELRHYLWRAGVHHPLPGFDEAVAALRKAEQAVADVEPGSMPNGKGRGAYRQLLEDKAAAERAAKALAAAGVNVQQAMALAGPKDARTHMRYVQLAKRGALAMPAVPRLRDGRDQRGPISKRRKPLGIGDPTGT